MTIEELKEELLGKTFPEQVQISDDQIVVDVALFLKVQFIEVDQWQRDITKCPGYVRLMRFRGALHQN
ncbi:DUF6965 family protein [Sphingobacterium bovistauri]|uniref:DUF6965 domain-containing protein n=1 Tax=Sphingobacterium bovistauri TaxID=2781959 RepID=A0ABS7Z5S5_9SPHI|nr:hypothetical protein [Sphingobacterium bovistauri]MCA5004937.1 hypothetical protein [Sphingobacterium bovistauri]